MESRGEVWIYARDLFSKIEPLLENKRKIRLCPYTLEREDRYFSWGPLNIIYSGKMIGTLKFDENGPHKTDNLSAILCVTEAEEILTLSPSSICKDKMNPKPDIYPDQKWPLNEVIYGKQASSDLDPSLYPIFSFRWTDPKLIKTKQIEGLLSGVTVTLDEKTSATYSYKNGFEAVKSGDLRLLKELPESLADQNYLLGRIVPRRIDYGIMGPRIIRDSGLEAVANLPRFRAGSCRK